MGCSGSKDMTVATTSAVAKELSAEDKANICMVTDFWYGAEE